MNKGSGKIEIRRLIKGIKKISSLPTVFAKVNQLLNDPRSCAYDFSKVISKDQALTARLLKLVNSAFYGFPRKIETVSRAVTIIGFRELRGLILATSVLSMFRDLGDNVSFTMEDFWKHNLACGIASRILATYKREKDPETYFVAGLLHDIGRLVLLESCPEKYSEVFIIVREESALMCEAEMDVFGFTHEAVGKELISSWKLPAFVEDAAGFHHNPKGGRNSSSYVDVVHVANILANAASIGSSGEKFVPPLNLEAWERIGLKKSILEPTFEKIYEQIEDAALFLLVDKKRT
ncbi:MAG: HDOD domain-containing protein [Desulfobacterales bacterium]|nr:HDOD domain-containing protein [Desulfobacterales bacterium]